MVIDQRKNINTRKLRQTDIIEMHKKVVYI